LINSGINPAINDFWAFVPRTTNDGTALSNHALGRAFDINRRTNLHIDNKDDIRVIRAVTGIDLGQLQPTADMRQASQTFQLIFNQQWVNQQTQILQQLQQTPAGAGLAGITFKYASIAAQQTLIQAINNRRRVLNGYARTGFFDLDQSLIDAFTGAGFSWGGQWQHEKDFMHFEIP
jgi:hypothetical protein